MIIDGITLSDQFTWENEFSWSPVGQTQDRSATGAFLVQEQTRTYGRPIDLVGGENAVWAPRSDILLLNASEATLDHDFNVTLPDLRVFRCKYNRDSGAAIQVQRLTRYGGVPTGTTNYIIERIRLVTVEP